MLIARGSCSTRPCSKHGVSDRRRDLAYLKTPTFFLIPVPSSMPTGRKLSKMRRIPRTGIRRIRYPAHRKSPYRHKVRSHIRKGRPVRSYMRGKGPKPYLANPVRRLRKFSRTSFMVRIEYPDYSSENFSVRARTFVDALDRGIIERKQFKIPLTISLRKHGF